jgi:hypothetical protein
MLTVKNSMKRSAAGFAAPAIGAGIPSVAHSVSARAVSGIAAFPRVLSEQVVEYRLRSPEIRSFQLFDRLTEINQAALRVKIEQSKRASNPKAFSLGYANTVPLINQQEVGVEGFR